MNQRNSNKTPVWHSTALAVLKTACAECDSWNTTPNSIMNRLKDEGIETTYASAATKAYSLGYKCPRLSRGGWHGNQYFDVNKKRRSMLKYENHTYKNKDIEGRLLLRRCVE